MNPCVGDHKSGTGFLSRISPVNVAHQTWMALVVWFAHHGLLNLHRICRATLDPFSQPVPGNERKSMPDNHISTGFLGFWMHLQQTSDWFICWGSRSAFRSGIIAWQKIATSTNPHCPKGACVTAARHFSGRCLLTNAGHFPIIRLPRL